MHCQIAAHNKSKLENSEQLLVVYNYHPESYTAFFVALEKKKRALGCKIRSCSSGYW